MCCERRGAELTNSKGTPQIMKRNTVTKKICLSSVIWYINENSIMITRKNGNTKLYSLEKKKATG
jgi:hypothetical protein